MTSHRYSPQNEPYRKLKATLAELRGKSAGAKSEASRQIETIVANMERWRWYPRDLGSSHVLVNQPDFTLKVMHNGGQVWTTRIVIGKPSMATPLLSETMKFITVYFAKIGLPVTGRIHELGCGTGAVCRAIASRPGFVGSVVGSDLSASLIETAKQLTVASELQNIEYYQADGQGSDAHKGQYDLVLAHTVAEVGDGMKG